jgi:hypothetical protein
VDGKHVMRARADRNTAVARIWRVVAEERAMSLVHLHLMLNHAPVIGIVFAALLLAFAALRRSDELTKVAFGILALIAVAVYRQRAIPRRVTATAVAGVLAAIGVVGYVANLGGQIRHTEIWAGAPSAAAGVVQPSEARDAREHQ